MSDVYRALGDPTRRQILNMLKDADRTQKEIVEAFDISQPAIKKHLTILLEENIVSATIQGKYRIYTLNQESLQIAYQEMLKYIGDLLDDQLESLKNYVEKGEERHDKS
ncbi:metalloregulator ArsR/SmtB family transcription factor [Paucisalibacillus globulus]|uniref:metalloregulator ArsR/SmtB family transcription factor n=1 Tax=Paucisalibacillus globulus TaxID=351095 RepID=UPI000BB8E07F|nr:metalloregulator ArsR/SmtB family transcription factor [Paucisalibacillus globulus]